MLNIFPQTLCSGDIYPLDLTFKDKTTGIPISLVGVTVGATVKSVAQDSDDTAAPYMKNIPGDATGVIQFRIGPLSAGDYWLDVKMWKVDGGVTIRTTVIPAVQMHIIQSVTTR